MHYEATHRLDLLRTVRLESLTSPTSQNTIREAIEGFRPAYNTADHCCCQRSRLSEECMVLREKKEKDFLLGEVCPLVFLKRNVSRVNKA
jgi:hypothetical protein